MFYLSIVFPYHFFVKTKQIREKPTFCNLLKQHIVNFSLHLWQKIATKQVISSEKVFDFFPIPIWTQWCNLVIKLYILIICLMFFFNIYEPFHCRLQRSWGSSGDQILLQNSCLQIWSQKLFLKKNWWNVLVHHTNTSKRSFHTSIKCSMYLISISIFFFHLILCII